MNCQKEIKVVSFILPTLFGYVNIKESEYYLRRLIINKKLKEAGVNLNWIITNFQYIKL